MQKISRSARNATQRTESGYPTESQMSEMWNALESGDDDAVLTVLKKRGLERAQIETGDSATAPDGPKDDLAHSENEQPTTPKTSESSVDREYPTDAEMEECWEAYKRDGKQGILEFLDRQV